MSPDPPSLRDCVCVCVCVRRGRVVGWCVRGCGDEGMYMWVGVGILHMSFNLEKSFYLRFTLIFSSGLVSRLISLDRSNPGV